MFYIYILYSSKSDKYYVGTTSDINRRLMEHNNPHVFIKYTAKHIPWELKLSFEVSELRSHALIVEKFIKKQKSRQFIEKLISESNNPDYYISLITNILKKNILVRAIPRTRD
jgi:putative endonuclease